MLKNEKYLKNNIVYKKKHARNTKDLDNNSNKPGSWFEKYTSEAC